ncbi:MAG TPA: hypothetical protein VEY67_01310 [Candidatus Dormibacteraeota bacterium]|nr:hypothetical protein [Candidatus Dormibacteraeota bacterium]
MRSACVPGFLPSRNALHFANRFPDVPPIRIPLGPLPALHVGSAASGLCGGMALVTCDLWSSGIEPPPDREPPAPGSHRFRALVRRQVQSLDALRTPLRFYDLQAFRPDRPDAVARLVGRRTRTAEMAVVEWPKVRSELDAGRLAPVGLVRAVGPEPWFLPLHHQAVAYAYEVVDDRLSLRIYDPNHPDDDEVEVRFRLGLERRGPGTMLQTTGEPVFAFWLLPYRPEPVGAWS